MLLWQENVDDLGRGVPPTTKPHKKMKKVIPSTELLFALTTTIHNIFAEKIYGFWGLHVNRFCLIKKLTSSVGWFSGQRPVFSPVNQQYCYSAQNGLLHDGEEII